MKGGIALAGLLVAVFVSKPAAATLDVVVLNVGEGQAVLLRREDRSILIDTGVAASAGLVLERLKVHGVRRLDHLILTHLHADHAGGYFRIREEFPDAAVIESDHPLAARRQPWVVLLIREAVARDPKRRLMRAGDTIEWQGVSVGALWPRRFVSQNLNRHSLVLLITYGGHRVLVMGDADAFVERDLLERRAIDGPLALLVAGHHGWRDTADPRFLAWLRPEVSVVSANWQNISNLPEDDVLERLRQASGQVLSTETDGEVCWRFPDSESGASRC